MSSVASEITALKNYTTELEAKTDTVTGADSENLTQSDFLKLLTQQLQYQDPMDPQDNSEFVSQLCQFSQLNVTTDISETLSEYTGDMKASSMVGQVVTLSDTTMTTTTTTKVTNGTTTTVTTTTPSHITGIVSASYLNGAKSGITINDKIYSIDDILFNYGTPAASSNSSQ